MRVIRRLLAIPAALALFLALASLGRGLHPALDTLSHFQLPLLVGMCAGWAVVGVADARWAFGMSSAALVLGAIGLGLHGPLALRAPQDPPWPDLRGYQHNLNYGNRRIADVEAEIRAVAPDVVTLQEVARRQRPLLGWLADTYPAQVDCPFGGVGSVAVLAREATGQGCLPGEGLAWLRVPTPTGEVTVVSVHLSWPWPYGQWAQVARLEATLATLPRPVILAGDFNAAPWSATARRIATAIDGRVAPGIRPTRPTPPVWPALPIDHVLWPTDAAGRVDILPQHGSDHHALGFTVSLRPERE